jgi:hypothetical protein
MRFHMPHAVSVAEAMYLCILHYRAAASGRPSVRPELMDGYDRFTMVDALQRVFRLDVACCMNAGFVCEMEA